jgi:hypothetical protein
MTTTTSAFYLVAVIVLLSLRSTDSVTPTHTPTAIPTISPTYAPSKVPSGNAPLPIAIHQLVTVEAGGNAVIKLKGFDMITPQNGVSIDLHVSLTSYGRFWTNHTTVVMLYPDYSFYEINNVFTFTCQTSM